MLSPIEKSRLKWACRRGMLELDVIFMPFLEHEFEHAAAAGPFQAGLFNWTQHSTLLTKTRGW